MIVCLLHVAIGVGSDMHWRFRGTIIRADIECLYQLTKSYQPISMPLKNVVCKGEV